MNVKDLRCDTFLLIAERKKIEMPEAGICFIFDTQNRIYTKSTVMKCAEYGCFLKMYICNSKRKI